MSRSILDEAHIHPAIRDSIANNHADIVQEVQAVIAQNDIVVVGMAQNPMPKKARKLLDQQRLSYKYLEYGSYLSVWRHADDDDIVLGDRSLHLLDDIGVVVRDGVTYRGVDMRLIKNVATHVGSPLPAEPVKGRGDRPLVLS